MTQAPPQFSAKMTTYQRITDSLRRRVLSREWQPGQRLPTEHDLCREFAASRITVRHALQILDQERLVKRRQGVGTFANPAVLPRIPILNGDFVGSIGQHAPQLDRRLHLWEWAQMDQELAVPLQACVGDPVLRAVRIDALQGKPVAFDEVALVGRYADRLTENHLAQLDFVRCWQDVQKLRFDYSTQTIEATKAKSSASRLLQIRAGEPLLKETNLLFVAGSQPAGLFVSYYRHDCFRFDVTFQGSKPDLRGTCHE